MEILTQSKLTLTLQGAKQVALAARGEAEANNWKVCIAIVDDGGNLMYFERMDGCQNGSIEVSMKKAMCAINFKRPSLDFQAALAAGKTQVLGMHNVLPLEGGLPLISGGEIVGAIGVSGVTSAEDGIIAAKGTTVLVE
jgi:glc operon protein GlcG